LCSPLKLRKGADHEENRDRDIHRIGNALYLGTVHQGEIIMTVKSLAKGTVPIMVGVLATGLLIRYFGDQPIISDAKKGLNGDVKGFLK
jgi:hypothetical protein